MKKSSLAGLLALGAAAVPTSAALAPTASAAGTSTPARTAQPAAATTATQTTVQLKTTAPQTHVRSGPGTNYSLTNTLSAGTIVTGTVTGTVSSSSWAKITSPSNLAGKYINVGVTTIVSSTPVVTPPVVTPPVVTPPVVTPPVVTPPVVTNPTDGQQVTRYTTTAVRSYSYPSASSTTPSGAALVPLTAVSGTWDAASGRVHTSTGWVTNTIPANPYNDIETHEWQDTTGLQAEATTDQVVTRYVVANRTNPAVRSAQSYTSTVMARVTPGTAVTGSYVSSHWFRIATGPNAGRYISSAVLFTTSNQETINGNLTNKDLCQVPDAMRYDKDAADQYLGCEALSELEAFSAQSPYKTTIWEGYRSMATQQQYYKQYGYPRAAVPGTSNHGLGEAIDLHYSSPSILTFSSPQVVDMMKNGPAFGWIKPTYLAQGTSNPEPWHFEEMG